MILLRQYRLFSQYNTTTEGAYHIRFLGLLISGYKSVEIFNIFFSMIIVTNKRTFFSRIFFPYIIMLKEFSSVDRTNKMLIMINSFDVKFQFFIYCLFEISRQND